MYVCIRLKHNQEVTVLPPMLTVVAFKFTNTQEVLYE